MSFWWICTVDIWELGWGLVSDFLFALGWVGVVRVYEDYIREVCWCFVGILLLPLLLAAVGMRAGSGAGAERGGRGIW